MRMARKRTAWLVETLQLRCQVGCEAGSPSRSAGGFVGMAPARTVADGAGAFKIPMRLLALGQRT
jgi:hypothetical protein